MPTARKVKEAFVLGNALKGDWNDLELFKSSLTTEKARIEELSDSSLNKLITDKHRLGGYDNATEWTFEQVRLDSCKVWPGMGKRAYMIGTVDEAANQFMQHGTPNDRLHAMTEMAKLSLYTQLPIILFRRKKNPGYRIDDGCHRSVATYLAEGRVVCAYVGTIPARFNHDW